MSKDSQEIVIGIGIFSLLSQAFNSVSPDAGMGMSKVSPNDISINRSAFLFE
jgi:hypothetical protein